MKVKLTYFKQTGKYYSSGEYETQFTDKEMWKIFDEVKQMMRDGKLPDLVEGCREFYALVEPQDDIGYPCLVMPAVTDVG